MDGDRDSERIEIELTSHSEQGRWRTGRLGRSTGDAPQAATQRSIEPPNRTSADRHDESSPPNATGPLATERGRLVVAALTTGVIALFVGWAFGHTSGSGSATDETPSSVARNPTTTAAGERAPGVNPSDLPTTTTTTTTTSEPRSQQPVGPSTTVAPRWQTSSTLVATEAAATGLTIVGITLSGQLVNLDLATGLVDSTDLRMTDDYGRQVEVGADWALAITSMGTTGLLLRVGVDPVRVDFPDSFQIFRVSGTDTFVQVEQPGPGRFVLHPVAYDGTTVGDDVVLDLPGTWWPYGLDPAATDGIPGLIVYGPSGPFRIDATGSRRVAGGSLVALSAETAVAYDCLDSIDSCGLMVTDRITGEVHAVPVPAGAERLAYQSLYGYNGNLVENTISPTGEHAIMLAVDDEYNQQLAIVSLVDGSSEVLSTFFSGSSVAWTPDGRYVFYLDGQRLEMYDLLTRQQVTVAPGLETLASFAIRPVAG